MAILPLSCRRAIYHAAVFTAAMSAHRLLPPSIAVDPVQRSALRNLVSYLVKLADGEQAWSRGPPSIHGNELSVGDALPFRQVLRAKRKCCARPEPLRSILTRASTGHYRFRIGA
jgi:hypothetical protein